MIRAIGAAGVALTASVLTVSGCSTAGRSSSPPPGTALPAPSTLPSGPTSTTGAPDTTTSTSAATTSVPPATTTTSAGLPPFQASVSGPLSPANVPYSWRPGCPVPPASLRQITLSYTGFDGQSHTGTIVVNAAVVPSVIQVFQTLYQARFPIRQMVPVDAFQGSDPASMAADNTSGFNCRYAVTTGTPSWSMHAYGDAIDVNPVENPYLEPGSPVQPPAGAAFAQRSDLRPGMAYPGGVLVDAFRAVGWGWGGIWSGPDYQHFSTNGQ